MPKPQGQQTRLNLPAGGAEGRWREGCLRAGAVRAALATMMCARTDARSGAARAVTGKQRPRETTQHCATLYSVVKGTAQREASPRSE